MNVVLCYERPFPKTVPKWEEPANFCLKKMKAWLDKISCILFWLKFWSELATQSTTFVSSKNAKMWRNFKFSYVSPTGILFEILLVHLLFFRNEFWKNYILVKLCGEWYILIILISFPSLLNFITRLLQYPSATKKSPDAATATAVGMQKWVWSLPGCMCVPRTISGLVAFGGNCEEK